MKIFISILALLFATNLWATDEYQQSESMVRLKGDYIEDSHIWTTFLSFFFDENEESLRSTARALGFDIEDTRDLKEFRKFQRKMELIDKKLKRSLRNSWYKAHCIDGKGGYGQSREEIRRDRDTAENMQKETIDKHMKNAFKSLSEEDMAKVRSFLDFIKERSTVLIADNQDVDKGVPVGDIQSNIAAGCVNLSGEYFSTNGADDES